MTIKIIVTATTVSIPKYGEEFTFVEPPEQLSKTALETLAILRKSPSLQNTSSREERSEVFDLLRMYGKELFQSIIPNSLDIDKIRGKGIIIQSSQPSIGNLPWELLWDGDNFVALTHGVYRSYKTDRALSESNLRAEQSDLKVDLHSYLPLERQAPNVEDLIFFESNRFISYVEELALDHYNSSFLTIDSNGNVDKDTIITALQNNPDLYLFSGFSTSEGWVVGADCKSTLYSSKIVGQDLTQTLKDAVAKGLRILILVTSDLIEDGKDHDYLPPQWVLNSGVPIVLTITSSVERSRFKNYFHNLILSLLRSKQLLSAHRHAINMIHSDLSFSWDWSDFKLHINDSLEEPQEHEYLKPFVLRKKAEVLTDRESDHPSFVPAYRRFAGSPETLSRVIRHFEGPGHSETLCLRSLNGFFLEEYVDEFFRRICVKPNQSFSLLYYYNRRYGVVWKNKLIATPIGDQFRFLYDESLTNSYFEESLIDLQVSDDPMSKYLVIYFPPEKDDPNFNQWLTAKQNEDWNIILCSIGSSPPALRIQQILSSGTDAQSIKDEFGDQLPEEWEPFVEDPLPAGMENLSLLRLAQQSKETTIRTLPTEKKAQKQLWSEISKNLIEALPASSLRVLLTLYLFRAKVRIEDLGIILSMPKIEEDIEGLRKSSFVEVDLKIKTVWIPLNLQHQIRDFKLLNRSHILMFGQDLLRMMVSNINEIAGLSRPILFGFFYCVDEIANLGAVMTPLRRCIQFSEKLSLQTERYSAFLPQLIGLTLELALQTNDQLLQKAIYSSLKVLDRLHMDEELVPLYEWVLHLEEKSRNWHLVVENQIRLANIYFRKGNRNKAKVLLTTSACLNEDISNSMFRIRNEIAICLLFLDMEDIEGVAKMIQESDFDPDRISKENLAKLWFIDGHLLFHSGDYKSAANSFEQSDRFTINDLSDSLLALTYKLRIEMYSHLKDEEKFLHSLQRAAHYLEINKDVEGASECHEKLWKIECHNPPKALHHLEWLYEHYSQSKQEEKSLEIANNLGELYFRIGNQTRSTKYYQIANSTLQPENMD